MVAYHIITSQYWIKKLPLFLLKHFFGEIFERFEKFHFGSVGRYE
jgi:hypothetical protein